VNIFLKIAESSVSFEIAESTIAESSVSFVWHSSGENVRKNLLHSDFSPDECQTKSFKKTNTLLSTIFKFCTTKNLL